MQEKAEDHMGSSHPPFSPQCSKLLTLSLLLIAASSCVYFLSPAFLTILVMVLPASLYLAFSKRKQLHGPNPVEKPPATAATCDLRKHAHDGGGGRPINGEAEEILLNSVDQIPAYSDSSISDDEQPEESPDPIAASSDESAASEEVSSESSISDEEGLIEIALPDGHPLGLEERKGTVFRSNLPGFRPDFSPEMVLRQQELLELFAEMNEEDSLIEIDIAVGSVKCSRLGIKA